jgi:uncharacterized protein YkwD
MGAPLRSLLSLLLASVILAACGGSNNGSAVTTNSSVATVPTVPTVPAQEPNAPQAVGNTATDGFNWFNFRRQQIGLQAVARNSRIDLAAQGHSDYQKVNDTITHEQIPGRPGFTGRTTGDRLAAADYRLPPSGYAYGEVISATSDRSGFKAAEDLIGAIYHRFVIFDPVFQEAGAGAASVAGGLTYFTTNFATTSLAAAPAERGRMFVYPSANQQGVPRNFFSDNETPDPIPSRNEVGYPISVHADITVSISVQSFTVRVRDATQPLAVQLLTHTLDSQTPESAAAIVPLEVLIPATTYDVQFVGTVAGVDASRSWSFTTR